MILARDTERGKFYRPTTGAVPGTWLERHRWGAQAVARSLAKKKAPSALDTAHLVRLQARPDMVPMMAHRRGTDPMTGERYHHRNLVLIPGDHRLREVTQRPGYTGRTT